MDILFSLAEHTANLFDAAGAFLFFIIVLGKNDRVKNRLKFGIISAGYIMILAYFQDISQNALVQLSNMILIDLVFELLFLKGKVGTKLVYNMIYNVVIMLASMITLYGLAFALTINISTLIAKGSMIRLLVLVINKILIFMVLFIIVRKIKRQEYHEWLITFFMFGGILYIGAILFNIAKMGYLPPKIENRLIIVAFGMLAICIAIAVCIYRLNQQYYYRIENMELSTKLREESYMLQKIDEMYEDNRILRHDLKHYLVIVQGMLSNHQVEEAMKYLDEVIGTRFQSGQAYYTNSSIVNTVLNDKGGICLKNKIDYEVQVSGEIPEHIQMEIGIMLSNIIDNAIEAQLKQETRWIRIKMAKHKGMFMIKVENYIHESVLERNPSFLTTKKDKINHGIGIRSVKKIVKKLEGIYSCEEAGHSFITDIMLPDAVKCD